MESKAKTFSHFVAALAIAETILIVFREYTTGMNRLDAILIVTIIYGLFYLSTVLAARKFKALFIIMIPIMLFYAVMTLAITYWLLEQKFTVFYACHTAASLSTILLIIYGLWLFYIYPIKCFEN